MNSKIKQNWENGTWQGSRRALIKQSLKLTVRERLEALEDLCKTSQKLASLKKSNMALYENHVKLLNRVIKSNNNQ